VRRRGQENGAAYSAAPLLEQTTPATSRGRVALRKATYNAADSEICSKLHSLEIDGIPVPSEFDVKRFSVSGKRSRTARWKLVVQDHMEQ
jgi:hypothetical protein